MNHLGTDKYGRKGCFCLDLNEKTRKDTARERAKKFFLDFLKRIQGLKGATKTFFTTYDTTSRL
jgi:hypothetical protein